MHSGTSEHDEVPCCLASVGWRSGMRMPLPALDDEDGPALPTDLPPVVDAHVHVFPDGLFRAIWRWFDEHGWPIRHKLYADDVIRYLRTRGVQHLVLLHYAHKPGIAREMNAFVADLVRRHEGVTGLATVYPGEPDTEQILADAFALGLRGVKLHCHVQGLAADDARLWPVYSLCEQRGLPVVIHAGREPASDALPVDPYAICDVARTARVLRAFPHLPLVVPHLGADEFSAYAELVTRHDNLWLDTTMMLAGYFSKGTPGRQPLSVADVMPWVRARPDRILYGTDFPNLPYAWDREARAVATSGLPTGDVERLLGDNARAVFGLPSSP